MPIRWSRNGSRVKRGSRPTIESRHLVRILDVGDGFFVMPYFPRGSLADALPLSVPELVQVAAEIAQALDALHARRDRAP